MIYLDNAATTLHKPLCVIDAVVNAMQTMGNSVHDRAAGLFPECGLPLFGFCPKSESFKIVF